MHPQDDANARTYYAHALLAWQAVASHGTTSAEGVRAFRYLTVFRYAVLGRAGGAAPLTPADSLARITRASAGELHKLWKELLAEPPDEAAAELGAMSGPGAPIWPLLLDGGARGRRLHRPARVRRWPAAG